MKLSLFIFLSGASAIWANQTPLSTGSGHCLSSDKIKADSYSLCCSDADTANEDTAGGVKFRYTCKSWAKPYDSIPQSANSAQECAHLCGSSSTCAAASWFSSRGECYLTSSQTYTQFIGTPGALLLEKMGEPTPSNPDDCTQQVADAVADSQVESEKKCQAEKAELEQTGREECQAAMTALEQNCELEKENLKPIPLVTDMELSGTDIHTICPQYDGREFETTGPNGLTHKWRILCDYTYTNVETSQEETQTNISSPYQRLKERQDLRALAWQGWQNGGRCWLVTMKPGYHPKHFKPAYSSPGSGTGLFICIDY